MNTANLMCPPISARRAAISVKLYGALREIDNRAALFFFFPHFLLGTQTS
jgi:hypothetical protein